MSVPRKIYGATVLIVMVVIVTTSLYFKIRAKPSQQLRQEPTRTGSSTFCLEQADVGRNIAKLSGEDTEVSDPVNRLLSAAGSSTQCRDEIIQALVLAMKGNRDLRNPTSFNLWSNGAWLLGSLKAVEALDFLIDHLNLSDGHFSASMNHQPAVEGVTRMGSAAVPKLADALKHHQNRDIRLTVALCLIDIGGPEASEALKEAAKTDSDDCVRRFIELSLMKPTADVLEQRLVAFRCGN
jgi:hypothetical protein